MQFVIDIPLKTIFIFLLAGNEDFYPLNQNDQDVLMDFYNSLDSSSLSWDNNGDLCQSVGIECDDSNPRYVITM